MQFQFVAVEAASLPRMLLRTADGRYSVQLQNDRFGDYWPPSERWPAFNFGHLWFLEHLLVYAALYAAFRAIMPRDDGKLWRKPPSHLAIATYAVLLAAATFTIRIWYPQNRWTRRNYSRFAVLARDLATTGTHLGDRSVSRWPLLQCSLIGTLLLTRNSACGA